MSRFDVWRGSSAKLPFLLDVQADLLDVLPTRLVVPLLPEQDMRQPIERLHLRVEVGGQRLILATNLLSSVPRGRLKELVGSLAHRRGEIVAAIDFLQQGF